MVPGRAVHVIRQAAVALVEAHAEGLIHRDVKPANIILTVLRRVPDVVKLVDFWLVKHVETECQDLSLTFHRSTTGTPSYMSPEAVAAPEGLGPRLIRVVRAPLRRPERGGAGGGESRRDHASTRR